MSSPSLERRLVTLAAQAGISVLVLAVLASQTDLAAAATALTGARWELVAASALLKVGSLTLHEVRLWVTLRVFVAQARAGTVVAIGYVSGLVNTLLPMRAGDLVAMALLRAETGAAVGPAVASVAITGFLEAALFGVFLLGVMLAGLARWQELLGVAATQRTVGTLAVLALGAVVGSIVLVQLAKRLAPREQTERPSLLEHVRDILRASGTGLGAWGPLLANLGLAAVQICLLVSCFAVLLPAVGATVPLPLLAASSVIALSALSAVALPPSLAAGPTAVAVLVLSVFGVSEAQAVAFAALAWLSNAVPPVLLGLVPLRGRLDAVWGLVTGRRQPAMED